MLYAVNVLAWSKFAALLGMSTHDPIGFLRLSQAMNAFAGAGCVAMLYLMVRAITSGTLSALLIAAGCAFSHAFLIHATNSAEPMVGLFWSFASVGTCLVALNWGSAVMLGAAGAQLAIAMATYQSMVLLLPALVVLVCGWPSTDVGARTEIRRATDFVAGFAVGCVVVFGAAYFLAGISTPLAMVRRFVSVEGGEVYGGLRLSSFANLPVGLAANLLGCVPREYAGIRWLIREASPARMAVVLGTVLASVSWVVALIATALAAWGTFKPLDRLALRCCAIGFGFPSLAALYWAPLYDKLWLQPLACLFVASLVMLKAAESRQWRRLPVIGFATVGAILALNLPVAVSARIMPIPCLADSEEVGRIVKSGDLVVTEWDDISQLYGAFQGFGQRVFDLPTLAGEYRAETVAALNRQMREAQSAAEQIYFLGVLDLDRRSWRSFLSDREGVSFDSFDSLRRCSRTVGSFTCRNRKVTLRIFDPSIDGCRAVGD